MSFKRKTPWTSQPQYPVGIDRSGELFAPAKLSAILLPSASLTKDAYTGVDYTASLPANGVCSLGRGYSWTPGGTTEYVTLAADADSVLDTTSCTMIVATVRKGSTTNDRASHGYDASATDRCMVHLPYTDNILYWDFGNATAGSGRVSVSIASYLAAGTINIWGFVAGSRGREIWRNGKLLANDAGATATRSATAEPFRFGSASGAFGGTADDTTTFFLLSKEQFSQAALERITQNPNLAFQPLQRKIYVASAGATTHAATGALTSDAATVAGTAAHIAKHDATGALTAQTAAVAGTAARIDIHTSTGALTADAAIIAGTAAHIAKHAATGALSAQSAAIVGAAARSGVAIPAVWVDIAPASGTWANQTAASGTWVDQTPASGTWVDQ